jgi:hypothetical protein
MDELNVSPSGLGDNARVGYLSPAVACRKKHHITFDELIS